MDYAKFTKHFSAERISKYAFATNRNKAKTMMLYKANMAVSQSFIPLICVLEVALRNNIDIILNIHFNDSDWILNQRKGFMNDPSLQYTDKKTGKSVDNRYHLKQVDAAKKKIHADNQPITSGRIIAEQTFGFWTGMYSVHMYKILKGTPIQIFSNLPSGYGRKAISDSLNQIKDFRNRISHHEPICFDSGKKGFSEAKRIHNLIIDVLGWIDPDIVSFLHEIDYVETSIKRMETKYNRIP